MTNDKVISDFLERNGWAGAQQETIAGDASTRSYRRLSRSNERVVLMIAPPAAETPSCPPEASDKERRLLGYNAQARLAGPNLSAFTTVAEALRSAGLSAPEVLAVDPDDGLALLEDLGDDLFARIASPENEVRLYKSAIDVLVQLHSASVPAPAAQHYLMQDYDHLALMTEVELLLDWYWEWKTGDAPSSVIRAAFNDLFGSLLEKLTPPSTIVLRDFHAENLLWLGERAGVARVGLIDFQDGLYGSPAYDVVSLLEDARRDVSPGLADEMIDYYCQASEARRRFDRHAFMVDYEILALQRNAKILGIFARLALRDGKKKYLDFMPRMEALFRRDLARSTAEPLNAYFKRYLPELSV